MAAARIGIGLDFVPGLIAARFTARRKAMLSLVEGHERRRALRA
jgi:hypothetical protein